MKYKPTLIIHGGAGALSRSAIPPSLYDKYHVSLLSYLRSTHDLLDSGSSALDAAVHAVSLLEDDELFNCARGSVFTSAGTIEMEASVMVTSINSSEPEPSSVDGSSNKNATPSPGSIKRGVGVIGLRNVKHPIQLAREVLLRTGLENNGDGGTMHAQLAAPYVEDLARQWGLEFEPDEYFWTQRRWDEHLRKLCQGQSQGLQTTDSSPDFNFNSTDPNADGTPCDPKLDLDLSSLPQGTVGCVCLDRYGNLAVATSTGGMTNKVPGRVGDTPTLGAGFWAERWSEPFVSKVLDPGSLLPSSSTRLSEQQQEEPISWSDCLPSFLRRRVPRTSSFVTYGGERYTDKDTDIDTDAESDTRRQRYGHEYRPTARNPEREYSLLEDEKRPLVDPSPYTSLSSPYLSPHPPPNLPPPNPAIKTTAVALSGTGNGDSFLRICAARTACAMARFSPNMSFARAVSEVAGPGGELQRSAGDRWGSGEGEGGIIGIAVEVVDAADVDRGSGRYQDNGGDSRIAERERVGRGQVVWDFNCGGMWRAWIQEDSMGREKEMVMVFKESYY